MAFEKHPKADLEKRRGVFLLISYVTVLSVVLIAFEWKTFDRSLMNLGDVVVDEIAEEIIPITRQEPPPPPPPPPPAPPEELEIVKDDEDVKDEPDIFDTEADENLEIKPMDVVEERATEPEIFVIVEDMPRFPGCEDVKGSNEAKDQCAQRKMMDYLALKLKYPQRAIDANITGTVYVEFVISDKGTISDVKVLRGIGGGCDEAAINVVKEMPAWKPGRQRGKPVPVRFTLPVKFVLKG